MKKLFYALCSLCIVLAPLCAGENNEKHFSLLFGGGVGSFKMDDGRFLMVYSNRSMTRHGFFALGDSRTYLIGKYRLFDATGKSELTNINVTGFSEWREIFYSAGFRLTVPHSPFYADVSYVIIKAEEKISTVQPVVNELTTSQKIENRGLSFGGGLAIEILSPFAIYGEGEYTFMLQKVQNDKKRDLPGIGGWNISTGIIFIF